MIIEKKTPLYIGVLLVSMSTLIYEILLTRILSVLMYYNFVSVVIALALFGISLSSIYVYINNKKYTNENIPGKITYLSRKLAFSIFFIFILIVSFRLFPELIERWLSIFQPIEIDIEPLFGNMAFDRVIVFVFSIFFLIAITTPFYLSGMCLTLVLFNYSDDIGKIYFSDLLGAGLGCILFIPAMNIFGAPSAIIIISALALGATFCFMWWQDEKKYFNNLLPILLIFIALSIVNSYYKLIDIDYVHGKYADDIVYSDWDALSRVVVYPLEEEGAENTEEKLPPRMGIAINETGYTAMTEFKNDFSRVDYLPKMINSLVFHIRPEKEALLIGPGGGEDIIAALYFKSKKVTAVEINGLLVNIVNKQFSGYSGSPYSLPKVETHINNARSFIKTTSQTYDIINASLVYEWFHPSGGAFSLSESHLYTQEAFKEYFEHLRPEGILAISRFSFEGRALRLVALGIDALKQSGIKNPELNIFIADDSGGFATFLFKKEPFTEVELNKLQSVCDSEKFTIIYKPNMSVSDEDSIYVQLLKSKDINKFYNDYPYDITPPVDDKPFLNYMIKPKDLFTPFRNVVVKEVNEKTVYLIRSILLLALFLTGVLLFVPWYFLPKPTMDKKKILLILSYFVFIGLGFMMVEIAAIRKFSLLLGNPIYSLSMVLFSILCFSGIGSFLTRKLPLEKNYIWLLSALAGIFVIIIILIFFTQISEPLFKLPLLIRMFSALIILGPMGICMGMPLPIAIKLLSDDKTMIPWVWSINGAASVAGSIAAFFIAMNFGFNIVLVLGSIFYVISGILFKYYYPHFE
ncbi:hypothetical protein HZA55_07710 [Candidatus Poribacteria bacterium]|nr:hypothetical protein [Candidatus Poribacteria bacterium]